MENPKRRRVSGGRLVRFTDCRLARDVNLVNEDLWVLDGVIIDPAVRWWDSESASEFLEPEVINCGGRIIAPGYVDIQINGAFGVDFANPADVTLERVAFVAERLLASGTVAFLPTLISSSSALYHDLIPRYEKIRLELDAMDAMTHAASNSRATQGGGAATPVALFDDSASLGSPLGRRPVPRARMLGLHLEGPFMNVAKKGAHKAEHMRAPAEGLAAAMGTYGSLGGVRLVTLAPELPGALATTGALAARGVLVSMGHTMATFDEGVAGVGAGARLVTHLFNAMPAFHHRDPGLVGLLGAAPAQRPHYSLIADGLHAHPASVKLASCAHPGGAILVTDAMAAMGLPDGSHSLGDQQVTLRGIRATVQGHDETLAGAVVPLDQCVRNYRAFTHCSAAEAIAAASRRPAQLLAAAAGGESGAAAAALAGTLDPGAAAELLLLDDDLNVRGVFRNGSRVWDAPGEKA